MRGGMRLCRVRSRSVDEELIGGLNFLPLFFAWSLAVCGVRFQLRCSAWKLLGHHSLTHSSKLVF